MEKMLIIRNAKFVESSFSDGSKQLVGIVRGDSFSELDIPTDPNPRQFIGDVNPNYKEMVKTLKKEPVMFARKNSGGITIFASACDYNGDGTYTLKFKKGDGIANGGHTFYALKQHGTAQSQVRITIEIGLNRDNIVEVAEALNLNRRLQTFSLRNKEGAYDWHKAAVEEKSDQVIYHEGDSGVVEIKEEMAFLNLFKFDPESNKLDILANIEQSEHANISFLNKITRDGDTFESSLKWIAKDVHELMMYTILNETYAILLKPLKKANGQNWLKTRGADKQKGILKGMGLMLVAGLAYEAIELNRNGIVVWKNSYRTVEKRKHFIDELFKKVFDVVSVEDGAASEIIRQDSVRKKVMRHAKLIGVRLNAEQRANNKKVS